MHKIDGQYNVDGEFVGGDKEQGIRATRLNASWFNTIQRELCNIVEQAGMALSENDDSQVLKAVLLHIVREMLGGKFHDGSLKLGDASRDNSVLKQDGIWFEHPESGVHAFVDDEGFGFTFTDDEGNLVKISLGKSLDLGDEVHIDRVVSQLVVLRILRNLVVGEEFSVAEILKVKDDAVRVLKDLFVSGSVQFGNGGKIDDFGNMTLPGALAARVLQASDSVYGNVFCSKIFDATTVDDIQNPTALLSKVAFAGATALVRNSTGGDYVISRDAGGSNHMYLTVRHGEVLLYAYTGSSWVHAW